LHPPTSGCLSFFDRQQDQDRRTPPTMSVLCFYSRRLKPRSNARNKASRRVSPPSPHRAEENFPRNLENKAAGRSGAATATRFPLSTRLVFPQCLAIYDDQPVAFVLMIACAKCRPDCLLARAAGRRRRNGPFASALGARVFPASRIIRQLLTEGLVIAFPRRQQWVFCWRIGASISFRAHLTFNESDQRRPVCVWNWNRFLPFSLLLSRSVSAVLCAIRTGAQTHRAPERQQLASKTKVAPSSEP